MSLKMKDLPLCIKPSTHTRLQRIAKARGGMSLNQIGREIIEEYVAQKVHESMVILGQDMDDLEQGELDLETGESNRIRHGGRK